MGGGCWSQPPSCARCPVGAFTGCRAGALPGPLQSVGSSPSHSAQHRFPELQLLLPTFRPLWERPSHPKGLCQIISGCPVPQTPNFCKRPIPRDHATVGPATFPFQPLQHKRSSAFLISSIQGCPTPLKIGHPDGLEGDLLPSEGGSYYSALGHFVLPDLMTPFSVDEKRRGWGRRWMRTLPQKLNIRMSFHHPALRAWTARAGSLLLPSRRQTSFSKVCTLQSLVHGFTIRRKTERWSCWVVCLRGVESWPDIVVKEPKF